MEPLTSSPRGVTWQAANVDEMLACGRQLASTLGPGAVILLRGEMGAGKTTLAKGIVEGLGAGSADDVSSPTFTLMHEYLGRARVIHLDLYRLETEAQVLAIGVEEWLEETRQATAAEPCLLLVEWGERFPALWPAGHTEIRISVEGDRRRILLRRPSAESPDFGFHAEGAQP